MLDHPILAPRPRHKRVMRNRGVAAGAWIKTVMPGEYTVLVSDLSGFTRITKQYGIAHMASVIIRMRQLCLPIMHKYEVEEVETEADNFICLFRDPMNALMAASEMKEVIALYERSLPADKKHFAPTLGGIGLDIGDGIVVDRWSKFHADVIRSTYHIGEDMCENGEILCSERVLLQLLGRPELERVKFEGVEGESKTGKLKRMVGHIGGEVSICSTEMADHFPTKELLVLTRRHGEGLDLKEHDADLERKYMKPKAALMFKLDFSEHTDTFGLTQELESKAAVLDALAPAFARYGGVSVEDFFVVFDRPQLAVEAALEARRTLAEYNRLVHCPVERVAAGGWGVHVGKMIFIAGTDVHWGDPVNTASKMGQDVAEGGEMYISEEVYKNLDLQSPVLRGCQYDARTVTVSKVKIKAYVISDPQLAGGGEGEGEGGSGQAKWRGRRRGCVIS